MKDTRNFPSMEDEAFQRRLALVVSVTFAILGFAAQWIPGVDEGPSRWISGMFWKLAIVIGAVWLAFPQIQRIQRLPFGSTIMGGALTTALIFLIRPKAVLYVLPVIIAAVIAMVLLGWFSRGSRKK